MINRLPLYAVVTSVAMTPHLANAECASLVAYFDGEHISALRCEHDVCDDLLAIDFEKQVVDAQVQLYIDCPDTGVAVNEVRLQFADIGLPGQPDFVPIMVVRER